MNKDESCQTNGKINIEQVVQIKCFGKIRGADTSEDKADNPTGRQQGKQAFGLPGVEKVVAHVPEQEGMQHFKLAFEHEE